MVYMPQVSCKLKKNTNLQPAFEFGFKINEIWRGDIVTCQLDDLIFV